MRENDSIRHNVKTIQARGMNFAYLEKGTGPLILCLHGYPDTAYSWIKTINLLADHGYRAVAPFMRGYYPTDIPDDGAYAIQDLAEDILALISAFGEEKAIIIGHDWGALAAYSAAAIDASKITKLITIDIIHPGAFAFSPASVWKARHIIAYQRKNKAIELLKKDNFDHIDEIYRRWSPNWQFDGETKDVKDAFAHPGRVEAALGYYWAFGGEVVGRDEKSKRGRDLASAKTTVPTLAIFGDWGAYSNSQMAKSKKAFSGPYEYIFMQGAGHFLHREAPERFFEHLSRYLGL